MIVAGPDFRVPQPLGVLQLVFILLALQTLIEDQAEYGERMYVLTSWARNPMQNAEAGGVKNSLHQVGLALDIDDVTPISLSGVASGFVCGVGSLFGLCKERPAFALGNRWRRIAPPFTQAVLSPTAGGSVQHFELDLT